MFTFMEHEKVKWHLFKKKKLKKSQTLDDLKLEGKVKNK